MSVISAAFILSWQWCNSHFDYDLPRRSSKYNKGKMHSGESMSVIKTAFILRGSGWGGPHVACRI